MLTDFINGLSDLLYSYILIILLLGYRNLFFHPDPLRAVPPVYRVAPRGGTARVRRKRAVLLPRRLWYPLPPASGQGTLPESPLPSVSEVPEPCSGCGSLPSSEVPLPLSRARWPRSTSAAPRTEVSYGGPAYYIQAALKKHWIGAAFRRLSDSDYMGGFNLVASFNIADSFRAYSFSVNRPHR